MNSEAGSYFADTTKRHFSIQRIDQRIVYIQVVFLRIAEINTIEECYDADISLHSRWREPLYDGIAGDDIVEDDPLLSKCWNPRLYIENYVNIPQVTVRRRLEMGDDEKAFILEHKSFRGTFIAVMNIEYFPFDVQKLLVIIRSNPTQSLVILLQDPVTVNHIHKSLFIGQQKFNLFKYVGSETTRFRRTADEQVQQGLTVFCVASRRFEYFITNIFIMTFIFGAMILLSFVFDTKYMTKRLHICYLVFMSALVFKQVIISQIPKLPRFTCVERYYYSMQVFQLLTGFYQAYLTNYKVKAEMHKIDFWAMIIFCSVYVFFNVVFTLWIIIMACAPRRVMHKKESQYKTKIMSLKIQRERSRLSKNSADELARRRSVWHTFLKDDNTR